MGNSSCINTKVELQRLSPYEIWKMFQDIVGDKTAQVASPREEGSSSKSTTAVGKRDQLVQYMLSLMKIWSFSHLILSYPFRIGHEEFLKQWINDVYKLCYVEEDDDANIDSLKRRVTHHLSESPLIYAQTIIPKEIINGGSINMETPTEDVPEPILHLATHLALQQLTHSLMSSTLPYSKIALDEKIQHIWLSTSNDEEKRIVVKNVQENSQISSAFDHVQVIDLSQIDDETQREIELSSLKTRLEQNTKADSLANHNARRSRQLVLVVDGDVDNKVDPQKLSLPIIRDSEHVAVFIITLSSSNELSKKLDLTIKTEDHLLPWELFSKIVGSELLHSSSVIHEYAVKIVEKCGGNLLAISLMAKSLKHVTDVQKWLHALQKLRDRDREAVFKLQKLETLSLEQCSQLLQISPQIARLENLKDLRLAGCKRLESLPQEIGKLLKLETLYLEHFSQLQELPPQIAELENLTELRLTRCESLKTLPGEIGKLQKLEILSLENCFLWLKLPPRLLNSRILKN